MDRPAASHANSVITHSTTALDDIARSAVYENTFAASRSVPICESHAENDLRITLFCLRNHRFDQRITRRRSSDHAANRRSMVDSRRRSRFG